MINSKSQIIVIVSAIVALIMNIGLAGLYTGYQYGITETAGFSISGESGNEFLVRYYLSICFLLLGVIVGSLIGSGYISRIICSILLSLIIPIYYYIYLQKHFYFSNVQNVTNVLKVSVPCDVVGFLIITGLIIGNAAIIIRTFQKRFGTNAFQR